MSTQIAIKLSFTRRELEILLMLADGFDSKVIAEKLHVSAFTIQTHRRNMQIRNNCKNTAELISYAFRNRIIS